MTEKERRAALKEYPRHLRDDLKYVMSSEQGRRLLHHLIYEECKLEGISYAAHANDTAFREGQRRIGALLQTMLRVVTPSEYIAMMAEKLQSEYVQETLDVEE